jgi:hypothetical protein
MRSASATEVPPNFITTVPLPTVITDWLTDPEVTW